MMPALRGHRRPVDLPDPHSYICRRCGVRRATKPDRPRPTLCRDCLSVERLLERPLTPVPEWSVA